MMLQIYVMVRSGPLSQFPLPLIYIPTFSIPANKLMAALSSLAASRSPELLLCIAQLPIGQAILWVVLLLVYLAAHHQRLFFQLI